VEYTWDQRAGLPVVLEDSAGNRYVYGLDLLVRINGSTEEWHLTDGLGSTVGLADDDGDVTDAYTYDAFGAQRSLRRGGARRRTWGCSRRRAGRRRSRRGRARAGCGRR
jgi:hypothetical protein